MKEKITAVVFDMDGVLFDTERICMEAWREIAAEKKIDNIEKAVLGCVGLNRTDTRAFFAREYGADFDYDGYHDACSARFHEKIDRFGLPIKPGVMEILTFLKENGYKIGLASSTSRRGVLGHVNRAGITDFFEVIVGGDMVEHSKPKPDIYLLACEQLGVKPENAIAIEDSPNGIRSAHAAGLKAVMVPDMIAPTQEIEALLYRKFESLLGVRAMLAEQKMRQRWLCQLCEDYSCSMEQILSTENVLTKKAYRPGRRIFRGDDCFLKLLIVNGKLVVSADDEKFLEENREFFENANAAWFFEPDSIRDLEKRLAPYGHEIADYHHFYLPGAVNFPGEGCGKATNANTVTEKEKYLHWYFEEELEQFRGDARFKEALSFVKESPDMLAVTWEENGEIFGMAGASADAENLWQIGINVLPAGEHRGLGTLLVSRLKDKILEMGKVPFYGTAESHIRSQRVAVGSGFMPAWAELYTRKMAEK